MEPRIIRRTIELRRDAQDVERLGILAYTGNRQGHRLELTLTDGGAPADMSGFAARAIFLIGAGQAMKLVADGEIAGSVVRVTFPEQAYAAGQATVVVTAEAVGKSIPLYAGRYIVRSGEADVVIDPEDVVPDLTDLLAQMDVMEAATKAANEAAAVIAILDASGNWAGVRQIVRQGLGPRAFPVGTQLAVAHTAYGGGTILFDVVDHDGYRSPHDDTAHTMTLLMHDCIYSRRFDGPELLWANTTGAALAAGTYNITLLRAANDGGTGEDGTYQFTTTKAIPAGGGIRHGNIGKWRSASSLYVPANIIGNHVTTYDASGATLESNIAVTSGSGGTSLGTVGKAYADCIPAMGQMNSTTCNVQGSNHWGESAIRQWLNSAEAGGAWWTRQTPFDMPPSDAYSAGFLSGIDPEFLAVVGEVDIRTAYNSVYNVDGTLEGMYTTRDRFFLASRENLRFGTGGAPSEGRVFAFYDGAADVDRIKYDIAAQGTARIWWTRSPNTSSAMNASYVRADGALSSIDANYGCGAAAACVIY